MEKIVDTKKSVEGVILILSCQKHLETRIKKFKLEKINSIRKMYIIRDTLKDYPFQAFNLHKIYYAGLQQILKNDNFIFHPMIACI